MPIFFNDDSSVFPWLAVGGGLAVGAHRFINQELPTLRARNLLGPTPGMVGAQVAAAAQALPTAEAALAGYKVPDFIQALDEVGARMAGQPTQAKTIVDLAMRQSLFAGNRLPVSDINELSIRLSTAPLTATGQQPSVFDIAGQAVERFGDKAKFYAKLREGQMSSSLPVMVTDAERALAGANPAMGTHLTQMETAFSFGAEFKFAGNEKAIYNELTNSLSGRNLPISNLQIMTSPMSPGGTGRGYAAARMRLQAPQGGPIDLTIPLTEGYYKSGKNLDTLYVTHQIYDFKNRQLMSFNKYYVGEMTKPGGVIEQIMNSPSRAAARQTLRDFEQSVAEHMVYSPHLRTPGRNLFNYLQQQTASVINMDTGAAIDDNLRSLFQQGFTPPPSPGALARGRVMVPDQDIRNFWPGGELWDPARRPGQVWRTLSPTSEALAAMKANPFGPGGIFQRHVPFLSSVGGRAQLDRFGQVVPQAMTTYALPGTPLEAALSRAGITGEMGLQRTTSRTFFQVEDTAEKIISGHDYVGNEVLKQRLIDAARTGEMQPYALKPGELIGFEPSTGKEIRASSTRGLSEEIVAARTHEGTSGFALSIRQIHKPKWWVKLFGQTKSGERFRSNLYMKQILSKAGIDMPLDAVESLRNIDQLRKNRFFLRSQMQSALAIEAAESMARGSLPAEYHATVARFLKGGAATEQWVLRNAATEAQVLTQATRWGLDVGRIAGALPHAVGGQEYRQILMQASQATGVPTTRLARSIKSAPFVRGIIQAAVGDFRYGGGGGARATLEPRNFMQLMGTNWPGPGGANVAQMATADLLSGMRNYGTEINEYVKSLRSMAGEAIPGATTAGVAGIEFGASATAREAISQLGSTGGYIKQAGYIMETGVPIQALGGATGVYVPPMGSVRWLDTYRRGGAGARIAGGAPGSMGAQPLLEAIHGFGIAAKEAQVAGVSTPALEAAAAALRTETVRALGASMGNRPGGAPGALRGEVYGGRFLTGESIDTLRMSARKAAGNVAEISQAAFKDMFADMMKITDAPGKEYLREQWGSLMKGGTVPIYLGRHPTEGPYSVQPIMARMVRGAEGSESFIRLPTLMNEVAVEGRKVGRVDFGPMYGMAGDLDADRYIARLVGNRKTADAMRKMLASGEFIDQYKRFAAESMVLTQAAKRRAAEGASNIVEQADMDRIIAGAKKMRLTKGRELGMLSTRLTELRMGVLQHAPEFAPQFNFLSEIMMQQIHSAKAGKGALSAGPESFIASLGHLQNPADLKNLARITEDVFGPEALKPRTITAGGQTWTMPGLNAEEFWSKAARAQASFRASPEYPIYSNLIKKASASSAKSVDVRTILKAFEEAKVGGAGPVSAAALRGTGMLEGAAAKSTQAVISSTNRALSEIGGAVRRSFGKPAIWALAAGVGMTMLLGGPQQMTAPPPPPTRMGPPVDSQAQLDAAAQVAGGYVPTSRDLRPDAMPMGGGGGGPSAPGMASQQAYVTNSGPNGRRGMAYNISAESGSVDAGALQAAIGSAVPGSSGTVRIQDQRRRLTADSLQGILEGY